MLIVITRSKAIWNNWLLNIELSCLSQYEDKKTIVSKYPDETYSEGAVRSWLTVSFKYILTNFVKKWAVFLPATFGSGFFVQ